MSELLVESLEVFVVVVELSVVFVLVVESLEVSLSLLSVLVDAVLVSY